MYGQLTKKCVAMAKRQVLIDRYLRRSMLSGRFGDDRINGTMDIERTHGLNKLAELAAWDELLTVAQTFTIADGSGNLDIYCYGVRFRALEFLVKNDTTRDRAAPLLAGLVARFLRERKATLHKESSAAFGIDLLLAHSRYLELAAIREELTAAREPVLPHSSYSWEWLTESIGRALQFTENVVQQTVIPGRQGEQIADE